MLITETLLMAEGVLANLCADLSIVDLIIVESIAGPDLA